MNNIDTLSNVDQNIELLPIQETVNTLSSVINSFDSLTDPQILELVNQILALLAELSDLSF